MTIEQKIANIAATYFEGWPYIFDNLYRIDERMESEEMPCICCTLPQGGQIAMRNGRYFDTENVLIGFFDIVPHDANGEDNAAVYNNMKSAGLRFIDKMNKSGHFLQVTAVNYEVWCVRLANIVTGVFFQLRVDDLAQCVAAE